MTALFISFVLGFLLGGFITFTLAGSALAERDEKIMELRYRQPKTEPKESMRNGSIKILESTAYASHIQHKDGHREWISNDMLEELYIKRK